MPWHISSNVQIRNIQQQKNRFFDTSKIYEPLKFSKYSYKIVYKYADIIVIISLYFDIQWFLKFPKWLPVSFGSELQWD